MLLHRRAAAVVAAEGFTGLFRRGLRKLARPFRKTPATAIVPAAPPMLDRDEEVIARQKAVYPALVKGFHERAAKRGLGCVEDFYWYHTVDLGDGLITPGDYDFRDRLADYHFPVSMAGMRVLDVGSATGFFAFEFERRGAEVVSVDLPSLADWDMIWSDRQPLMDGLMDWQNASTPEELHWKHLEGPFQYCHRALGSKVRRCLSRIYDLTTAKLGADGFDLIFLGDILGHLFSPLQALNVLAPLCRGKAIISYDLSEDPNGATLQYGGGEVAVTDSRSWFRANWECLRRMLKRVGFRDVQQVGHSRVLVRRAWVYMSRVIVHATR